MAHALAGVTLHKPPQRYFSPSPAKL